MMVSVAYRKWGKFSGPRIIGDGPKIELPENPSFWDKTSYLTALVEGGNRIGTVIGYDGTGTTAGIHQAVACFPRDLDAQGPLFKLLWRIDHVIPITGYTALDDLFRKNGWTLAPPGELVYIGNGKKVTGKEYRDVVTPVHGVVPDAGDLWMDACKWARAWHEVFSDERTLRVQMQYGLEKLVKFCQRARMNTGFTVEELAFANGIRNPEPFDSGVAELAHAIYFSFSVNAPAWARFTYSRLSEGLAFGNDVADSDKFGVGLVRALRRKNDKWEHRMDRTLKIIRQEKLWPVELVERVD